MAQKQVQQKWQEMRPAMQAQLAVQDNPAQTQQLLAGRLEVLQQEVMAKQRDAVLRQQWGILFAQAKASLRLLSIEKAPQLWTSEPAAQKRRFPFAQVGLFAVGLVLGGMLLRSFYLHELYEYLLMLVAALLCFAAQFLMGVLRKKATDVPPEHRITQHVDAGQAVLYMDRLTESLDRNAEELQYLNGQAAHSGETTDTAMLELCQKLVQAGRDHDEEMAVACVSGVEAYLAQKGIEVLDYSPEHRANFDTLQTKQGSYTVKPALRRREDGTVLLRGVAAVAPGGQEVSG